MRKRNIAMAVSLIAAFASTQIHGWLAWPLFGVSIGLFYGAYFIEREISMLRKHSEQLIEVRDALQHARDLHVGIVKNVSDMHHEQIENYYAERKLRQAAEAELERIREAAKTVTDVHQFLKDIGAK